MVIEYDDGVAAMSQPSSRQRVTSKSLGQPPQPPQPGSSAAASLGVRIAMIASVSLPVPPRHRLQACGARAYDVPLPALLARRLAPQTSHLVEEDRKSTRLNSS